MTEGYGFETLIVDDPGGEGGSHTGDVVSPIHLSTTFETEEAGAPSHSYKYSRFGNPTRDELEATLVRLEGAEDAIGLSSGMAAISTVCLTFLSPGDHVVAFESLFGARKKCSTKYWPTWALT